jgi:hypothetical protein
MIKIYLYIILVLSFASCNLFTPRDAEEPTEDISNFQPPITADIVIENLTNSIIERNSINYSQCFGGNNLEYNFIPAAEVQANYPSIFSWWDIASEKSYFDNLIIQTDKYSASSVTFANVIRQSTTSDSIIYQASYNLNFEHSATDVPKVAIGNLQFSIKRDRNNNWYITRWTDFKIQNQFSWSDLKVRFSN